MSHTRKARHRGSSYQCKHLLQIVLGRLLGKGMFGQTYLGCWRGGDLAVKCVRVSKESEAASFLREVAALAAIRHPNVMQFYGEPAQRAIRSPLRRHLSIPCAASQLTRSYQLLQSFAACWCRHHMH